MTASRFLALGALFMVLAAWDLPPFAGGDVETDNAYVRGRTTVIAPQVSGYDPENGHPGIDFAAEEGAEVYAVADGIVTTADYDAEKGNYVVLDHGGGLETEYQHLKSSLVSAGQSVVQSQVLGYVGSTGNSTGPHLHFEARQDSAPADLTGTALLAE